MCWGTREYCISVIIVVEKFINTRQSCSDLKNRRQLTNIERNSIINWRHVPWLSKLYSLTICTLWHGVLFPFSRLTYWICKNNLGSIKIPEASIRLICKYMLIQKTFPIIDSLDWRFTVLNWCCLPQTIYVNPLKKLVWGTYLIFDWCIEYNLCFALV